MNPMMKVDGQIRALSRQEPGMAPSGGGDFAVPGQIERHQPVVADDIRLRHQPMELPASSDPAVCMHSTSRPVPTVS